MSNKASFISSRSQAIQSPEKRKDKHIISGLKKLIASCKCRLHKYCISKEEISKDIFSDSYDRS